LNILHILRVDYFSGFPVSGGRFFWGRGNYLSAAFFSLAAEISFKNYLFASRDRNPIIPENALGGWK
jgi:hypothetical protein